MLSGSIFSHPYSVDQIFQFPDLSGTFASVHGIVYSGSGTEEWEYLLLPKDGPFDGNGPIPMPTSIERDKCILIDEKNLGSKFGSWACGDYRHKFDAIVIGKVVHQEGSAYPIKITDIWLIVGQNWEDYGTWTTHNFNIYFFGLDKTPSPPWEASMFIRDGYSRLKICPE